MYVKRFLSTIRANHLSSLSRISNHFTRNNTRKIKLGARISKQSFLISKKHTMSTASLSSATPFCMGHQTHKIPMALFAENRFRLRMKLQNVSEAAYCIVLLQGGDSLNHYNTDVEYIFRQESNFHWMFGVTEPGFFGALDVSNGNSYLFIPRLPKEYAVWMGKLLTIKDVKDKYDVQSVHYIDEMAGVLSSLNPTSLLTLAGKNTDSDLEYVEPTFKGISEFSINNEILYPQISECRVFKTPYEIDVMRYVCKISSEAHKTVMATIKPGMYEYQGESTFLHYCYSVGGCRHPAYTSICGSGCNGAILHYGHAAAPNSKKIEEGNLCLFDMGGTYHGYCADITCTFPINGKFTEKQKIIYNAVLKARNAVIEAMKPGVSWVDMHLLANKEMLQELIKHEILRGNVCDMLKDNVAAVFQPHGLGHLLGCDVHDVGGYLKSTPERPTRPGLKSLRTARILGAGMIITVEPGCYFIDELLDQALSDETMKKYFNEAVINEFRNFGGVRIEDDVLVTEYGVENLVNVPRTVEEIEEFMEKKQMVLPKLF